MPTSQRALVRGGFFADHPDGLWHVGAPLGASEGQGSGTAVAHLRAAAATIGQGSDRVRAVLDLVGLDDVTGQRIESFSLGMRRRLGAALALLGDAPVAMFDEPVNNLPGHHAQIHLLLFTVISAWIVARQDA